MAEYINHSSGYYNYINKTFADDVNNKKYFLTILTNISNFKICI